MTNVFNTNLTIKYTFLKLIKCNKTRLVTPHAIIYILQGEGERERERGRLRGGERGNVYTCGAREVIASICRKNWVHKTAQGS